MMDDQRPERTIELKPGPRDAAVLQDQAWQLLLLAIAVNLAGRVEQLERERAPRRRKRHAPLVGIRGPKPLTGAQSRYLDAYIASGKNNAAASRRMGISPQSGSDHLRLINLKLSRAKMPDLTKSNVGPAPSRTSRLPTHRTNPDR